MDREGGHKDMTEFDIEEIKKEAGGDLPGPIVTEQDINFVIDSMCKEAKHDRPAIKQLFYALHSGMTHLGIHHKVNSKNSGAGKTYVTKIVASYFPSKHLDESSRCYRQGIFLNAGGDGDQW